MIRDYFTDLPDYDYPSFKELFFDVVNKYSERVAIRMRSGEGKGYDVRSFGDLRKEVKRVTGFLCSLKLTKGDKVGIYAENSVQWCCVYLAAVVTGLVIVPIDVMLGEDDAVPIIEDSDLTVLFFSKRHADKIPAIRKRCTTKDEELYGNTRAGIQSEKRCGGRHITGRCGGSDLYIRYNWLRKRCDAVASQYHHQCERFDPLASHN